MKFYNVTYSDKYGNFVSMAQFVAKNFTEAKRLAQTHKNMTPEIRKAKKVKTEVFICQI